MSKIDKHFGGETDDLDRTRSAAGKQASGQDERDGGSDLAEHVRDTVTDGYERARDLASEGYDSLARNAGYARRRSIAELDRGRRGVAAFIEENPIMVGVTGFAAGLLIGSLMPGATRENRYIGPYADDLRREGIRYAKDVARNGRETIYENLRAIAQPGESDHS